MLLTTADCNYFNIQSFEIAGTADAYTINFNADNAAANTVNAGTVI